MLSCTTSINRTDEEARIPDSIALSCISVGTVVFSIGIFGNLLVAFAVLWSPKLRRPYNAFIVSFAVSDLMILLTVGIFQLHTCRCRLWVFNKEACLYLSTMISSQLILSGMHIVAISCYRYITVVHHHLRRYINHRCTVTLTLFIMYTTTFCVFPLARILRVFPLRQPIASQTFYDTKSMMCIVTHLYRTNILGFIIIICIGSLLLLYFYCRIHQLVRHNQARLRRLVESSDPLANGIRSSVSRKNGKDIRILKTMCIIFVMYVGSQAPLPLLLYLDDKHQWSHAVYFPWVVFLWLSSSTNWIVYGILNRDFTNAYRAVFQISCIDSCYCCQKMPKNTEETKDTTQRLGNDRNLAKMSASVETDLRHSRLNKRYHRHCSSSVPLML